MSDLTLATDPGYTGYMNGLRKSPCPNVRPDPDYRKYHQKVQNSRDSTKQSADDEVFINLFVHCFPLF